MWRQPYWAEGHYIDNHEKYNCLECGKDFIVGKKFLENCLPGYPICPYCGSKYVKNTVRTDEIQLEEFADFIGCLGIYIDGEENGGRQMAERKKSVSETVEAEVISEVSVTQPEKMEFRLINPTEDGFLRVIKWNKEELEATVRHKIAAYQNVVYTEDNIKQAKADRAELNKLTKAIEERRKMVKKIINEPYNVFEAELKDILALIQEPVGIIDKQVKIFEDQQKEEKKKSIQSTYDEIIGDLASVFPFEKVFDNRYLNQTYKLTTAQMDIKIKVEKIRTDLKTIDSLESKYKLNAKDVYIKTLDLSKALAENKRLSDLEEKLEAEKRRKAEEEAEKKRLVEEHQKEEKKRLAEEQRKEQEARMKTQLESVSKPLESVIKGQENGTEPVSAMEQNIQSVEQQAFATAIDPFAQQQEIEPPKVTEKQYQIRFYAKGTRGQLEQLIQFMNNNRIEYGKIKS